MIYRVAICDDCREDRDRLKRLLLEFESEEVKFNIVEFRSGEELLAEKELDYQLIFLDFQMREITGQEVANRIREKDQQVILVFYTGVVEPTADNFRVQAFRYLMKNWDDNKIRADLKDIVEHMETMVHRPTVWAQVGPFNVSINLDDIIYIEKYKRGLSRIYTVKSFLDKINVRKNEKVEFVYSVPLDLVYDKLKDFGFEYAHSSYIVNFKHVVKYSRLEILMNEGIPLTLTRSKVNLFRQRMKEYLIEHGL